MILYDNTCRCILLRYYCQLEKIPEDIANIITMIILMCRENKRIKIVVSDTILLLMNNRVCDIFMERIISENHYSYKAQYYNHSALTYYKSLGRIRKFKRLNDVRRHITILYDGTVHIYKHKDHEKINNIIKNNNIVNIENIRRISQKIYLILTGDNIIHVLDKTDLKTIQIPYQIIKLMIFNFSYYVLCGNSIIYTVDIDTCCVEELKTPNEIGKIVYMRKFDNDHICIINYNGDAFLAQIVNKQYINVEKLNIPRRVVYVKHNYFITSNNELYVHQLVKSEHLITKILTGVISILHVNPDIVLTREGVRLLNRSFRGTPGIQDLSDVRGYPYIYQQLFSKFKKLGL